MGWSSQKKPIIAFSTSQAEYIAHPSAVHIIDVTKERMFQIGFRDNANSILLTDNHSTVQMVTQSHGTQWRKFIDFRHHLVQQML